MKVDQPPELLADRILSMVEADPRGAYLRAALVSVVKEYASGVSSSALELERQNGRRVLRAAIGATIIASVTVLEVLRFLEVMR